MIDAYCLTRGLGFAIEIQYAVLKNVFGVIEKCNTVGGPV